MAKYIKYSCKKCSWEGSIRTEWSDLKPKKCPSCKTSFVKYPDQLLTELPAELTKAANEVLNEGE